MMKIKPYDIIELEDGNFFLIRNITEKRVKGSISKILFANGFVISEKDYTVEKLRVVELKKIIEKYESENIISINLEQNIKSIISVKKKAEWRLNKKVSIL